MSATTDDRRTDPAETEPIELMSAMPSDGAAGGNVGRMVPKTKLPLN
jgi:hypothetical protein